MELLAVDKTGRRRLVEPLYKEQSPAIAVDVAFRDKENTRKLRSFRFLSDGNSRVVPDLAAIVKPPNHDNYVETSRAEARTDIFAFSDAQNNQVFFRKREIIIGFARRSAFDVANVILQYDMRLIWFDHRGNFGKFNLTKTELDEVLSRLQKDSRVLFAEPNVLDGANLPGISDLERDGVSPPTYLAWNHLALNRNTGGSPDDGKGIVIAIVDTPISLDHPGLAAALYLKSHELYFGDQNPVPDSHGTAVASILVDSTPIGPGFSLGLCPSARLLPVSIDTSALSSYARRATAINFLARSAVAREVVTKTAGRLPLPRLVVNCSWQVRGTQDLTAVSMAFSNLTASGAICVCSAGNDNSSQPHFPSDYANCISVAAVTRSMTKSKNSNFGRSVSFAMPGGDGSPYGDEDILAAQSLGLFDYVSGTSFAAPHASALLTTIWSRNPNMTAREVIVLASTKYSVAIDSSNPNFVGQLGAGLICFA